MLVDGRKFQTAADKHPHPLLRSNRTCSASFSASAPARIVSGTGRYKGISGTLELHATFAGISPRKNGKCPHSEKTTAGFLEVTGTGTVKFG